MTVLNKITKVLVELGGIGSLKEIYQGCKEIDPTSKDPSIRQCIEAHSSDSDHFQRKKDIFYSVYGKGNGIWGLRDYQPLLTNMTLTQDDISASEGRKKLKLHIVRERNYALITKAKSRFKQAHDGKLFCEICGFSFLNKYGELGSDFIEVHHVKAISEMKENEETNINDLVMVCSNCHSMLHRRKPWLSKDELKQLLIST